MPQVLCLDDMSDPSVIALLFTKMREKLRSEASGPSAKYTDRDVPHDALRIAQNGIADILLHCIETDA
jgi:hypothetical protein